MTPPQPFDRATDDTLLSKRVRALVLFLGVWLIGTGFTLLFARHPQNPFAALTSKVPQALVPVVMGAYAAVLAGLWAARPRFRRESLNELICTGVTVVGGVFAPHTVSLLFGLSP